MFDTQKYPYSLVAVPQGGQPRDRPEQGLEARRVRLRAADRRDRPERAVPVLARQDRGRAGQDDGQLQPGRREEAPHRRRLHLQGQRPLRPEGRPRQVRHPRHLGLVGLGRLAPDHHEEPAGHRHRREREARARLGLLVPERDEHEVRDPALADRRTGLALRLLLQQHAPEHVRPVRRGRRQHRATSPTSRTRRRRRCSTSGRRRSTSRSRSS